MCSDAYCSLVLNYYRNKFILVNYLYSLRERCKMEQVRRESEAQTNFNP